MINLRLGLSNCFPQKKKDKNSGGDEDDNKGGDGEKVRCSSGNSTSANDAVHNARAKRKRVEECRINQGNRESSGISKNKNTNVPPKSTSHHSRSSRSEDFSAGTDDNKNDGDGGDDDKKGISGGDDGNNRGCGGSGSGGSGAAGFGFHRFGYHRLYRGSAVDGFGYYQPQSAGFYKTGAKRQRNSDLSLAVEECRINQRNRECSGISKNKNKNVPPNGTSHPTRSSRSEDFSGGTDDNKNNGDGGDDSDDSDDDKKGISGGNDGNNRGCGGGGSGGSGAAGFGFYTFGYHQPQSAGFDKTGAKRQRNSYLSLAVEQCGINQGNRECSGISKNKNKNVPSNGRSHPTRSNRSEDFSGGTDDNKNGGDDGNNGSDGGDDGNNGGGGGGGGSGSNNKD